MTKTVFSKVYFIKTLKKQSKRESYSLSYQLKKKAIRNTNIVIILNSILTYFLKITVVLTIYKIKSQWRVEMPRLYMDSKNSSCDFILEQGSFWCCVISISFKYLLECLNIIRLLSIKSLYINFSHKNITLSTFFYFKF